MQYRVVVVVCLLLLKVLRFPQYVPGMFLIFGHFSPHVLINNGSYKKKKCVLLYLACDLDARHEKKSRKKNDQRCSIKYGSPRK